MSRRRRTGSWSRRRRGAVTHAPGTAIALGDCEYCGPAEKIGWAERQAIMRESMAAQAIAARERTANRESAIDFRETGEG